MELIDEIEDEIEKLKDNEYGLRVTKTKYRGIITTSILIPQEIINKEISEMNIEFQLIIDTNSLKLMPKLYCVSPFCFPHFADGRDLFYELKSSKIPRKNGWLSNLLSDILEFIKVNFEKGGLYFVGNYYLGTKYDLRLLQKGCETIINVRENLVINGKNLKINRVLVLSDVYFLLFEQEKWYKNNLTLLFWSSISNIQKIQKVKDNKTLILQWTQKEKETYPMSLTLIQRDLFIETLLEKMNHFGMVFDVTKMDNNNNINAKKKFRNEDDISQSQNVKLINDYNKQEKENNKEGQEEEEYEEGEEEEDDEEDEKTTNKEENNIQINVNLNNNEQNKDNMVNNNMKEEKEKEIKGENKIDEVKNMEEQKENDDDFIEVKENNDNKNKNEEIINIDNKDEQKNENDVEQNDKNEIEIKEKESIKEKEEEIKKEDEIIMGDKELEEKKEEIKNE